MARIKEISIADLRIGMFLHDMDIPWIQSPFLRSRCMISAPKDIALLTKAGAKRIWIDLDKGVDVEDLVSPMETAENGPAEPSGGPSKTGQSAPKTEPKTVSAQSNDSVSAAQELKAATAARNRAEAALGESFSQWEKGKLVIDDSLEEALAATTASLARNDQALLRLLAEARREPSLVTHAFATFTLISALAQKEGLEEEASRELGLAAILHDFGWLKLPGNLFRKSRFSAKEQQLAEQHVALSLKLLDTSASLPARVRLWVANHEVLPLADRQSMSEPDHDLLSGLQVTDQYDHLCAGTAGLQGRVPSAALAYLYKASLDGVYQTIWVQRLIYLLGVYPLGSAVELSNHEKGVVVEMHRDHPLQPVVEIRYNRVGQPLLDPELRDLSSPAMAEIRIHKALDLNDPHTDPARILRT